MMTLKFNFLIILFASFMAFSCTDDTDELIGSWDLISLNVTGCDNNLSLDFQNSGCTEFQGVELCTTGRTTFNESGSYTTTGNLTADGQEVSDLSNSGTWARTGESVVLCNSTGDCNGSTIRVNGNNVTVTRTDEDGCLSTGVYEKN